MHQNLFHASYDYHLSNPFSFVYNPKITPSVKVDSISYKTFLKDIQKLTIVVEIKLRKGLADKFSVVFYRCYSCSTHYLAIYLCHSGENDLGYLHSLLGFWSYVDETKLGANEPYDYITFTLSAYRKDWDNVTALIADNCAVRKVLLNSSQCSFLGSESNRYNLAIKTFNISAFKE